MSDTAVAETRLSTGDMVGRYKVVRMVGQGAFGTVYEATDTELDRNVAIKVPRPGDAWTGFDVERLAEEARSLAKLNHPSIVLLYEVVLEDNGMPLLVMELLEGPSLRSEIGARSVSLEQGIRILVDVAAAAHYAHQHGFVHRDLNPCNILTTVDGRPKIVDFGLAVHESSQSTAKGEAAGSLRYMSPEQLRGESHWLDGRSDIWAIGAILYELLAGVAPFSGTNIEELTDQILSQSVKPPRQTNSRVPAELEAICLRCLRPVAADRFATAGDLADALRNWLDGRSRPLYRDWRVGIFVAATVCGLLFLYLNRRGVGGGKSTEVSINSPASRQRIESEQFGTQIRQLAAGNISVADFMLRSDFKVEPKFSYESSADPLRPKQGKYTFVANEKLRIGAFSSATCKLDIYSVNVDGDQVDVTEIYSSERDRDFLLLEDLETALVSVRTDLSIGLEYFYIVATAGGEEFKTRGVRLDEKVSEVLIPYEVLAATKPTEDNTTAATQSGKAQTDPDGPGRVNSKTFRDRLVKLAAGKAHLADFELARDFHVDGWVAYEQAENRRIEGTDGVIELDSRKEVILSFLPTLSSNLAVYLVSGWNSDDKPIRIFSTFDKPESHVRRNVWACLGPLTIAPSDDGLRYIYVAASSVPGSSKPQSHRELLIPIRVPRPAPVRIDVAKTALDRLRKLGKQASDEAVEVAVELTRLLELEKRRAEGVEVLSALARDLAQTRGTDSAATRWATVELDHFEQLAALSDEDARWLFDAITERRLYGDSKEVVSAEYAVFRALFPSDNIRGIECAHQLANIRRVFSGRQAEYQSHLTKLRATAKRVAGAADPRVGQLSLSLGSSYLRAGKMEKALECFTEARESAELSGVLKTIDINVCKARSASALWELGGYRAARRLREEVLTNLRTAPTLTPAEQLLLATTLRDKGRASVALGDLDKGMTELHESLPWFKCSSIIREDSQEELVGTQCDIANIHLQKQQWDLAQREVESILRNAPDSRPHLMSKPLELLPVLQARSGNREAALVSAQRALEHCPEHDRKNIHRSLGIVYRIRREKAACLSAHHASLEATSEQELSRSLRELTVSLLQFGDYTEATARASQLLQLQLAQTESAVFKLSEAEALRFRKRLNDTLGLLIASLGASAEPDSDRAYAAVLSVKGAVERAMQVRRQLRGLEPDRWAELALLRRRLAQANPADQKTIASQKEQLERELTNWPNAVKLLRKANSRPGLNQSKRDATVVQFVRSAGIEDKESSYEAFVVTPSGGNQTKVEWVRLGKATTIDRAVSNWHKAISSQKGRGVTDRRVLTESSRSPQLARETYDLVWKRISPLVKDNDTIVVCPAGKLYRLPWAALPGTLDDSYLGHQHLIVVANSARDVVGPEPSRVSREPANLLAVGDIDYGIAPNASKQRWRSLPGARKELAAIKELVTEKELGFQQLSGSEATVSRVLTAMPKSSHIHLATHGYYFATNQRFDPDFETRFESVVSRNPLLASGLVLVGANTATPERPGKSGLLSAEAILSLDLRSTRLVVLSACESGLGRIEEGEGVFGLQRAFIRAGARVVVTSLWPVDDNATAILMTDFYDNHLRKGRSASESLQL
ncbi:MAG: CHAT domain-containing protein [Planctomycetaceae bacterium]